VREQARRVRRERAHVRVAERRGRIGHVEEASHDLVDPDDLVAERREVRRRCGAGVPRGGELVREQRQLERHRVQWILDVVGDARREAREPLGAHRVLEALEVVWPPRQEERPLPARDALELDQLAVDAREPRDVGPFAGEQRAQLWGALRPLLHRTRQFRARREPEMRHEAGIGGNDRARAVDECGASGEWVHDVNLGIAS